MGIHRLTFVLPTPAITVVVPYYNEQESLRYLLDQLAAQTLAPREVILVNSSSTDGSSALIDEWISSHVTETVFRNLNASTTTPGGSKTAGVNVATGELLAFMDCDLTFPTEWLQRQAEVLASTGADWVSGVCRTRGTTIIDRAAIAHTYGYMNTRPVIPSSLVRRSVFERIGMFKDLRAGYDVEWARASSRAGLRREINHHVVVEYRGVNFAKDLRSVFLKSIRYARPSVGRDDTVVPYVYVLGALGALLIAALAPLLLIVGAGLYVIGRLAIAWRKSSAVTTFLASPTRVLALIVVGAVMDFGKLCGFVSGIFIRYVRRRTLVR